MSSVNFFSLEKTTRESRDLSRGRFKGQAQVIVSNPFHIILIVIPLIFQAVLIFLITYLAGKALHLGHPIAAPAAMIGASNFFELAVTVAVALFGTTSPAALATTVGVLVEVPVMLGLVHLANSTRHWFHEKPAHSS